MNSDVSSVCELVRETAFVAMDLRIVACASEVVLTNYQSGAATITGALADDLAYYFPLRGGPRQRPRFRFSLWRHIRLDLGMAVDERWCTLLVGTPFFACLSRRRSACPARASTT